MTKDKNTTIDTMFRSGFHFGVARSRRHPSTAPYIFGVKNKTEIFDLEKSDVALVAALEFVKKIAATGKQILFVTGKSEAKEALTNAAEKIHQPFVAGRWIGGTLTNFKKIRKRIEKFETRQVEKKKASLRNIRKKNASLSTVKLPNSTECSAVSFQ